MLKGQPFSDPNSLVSAALNTDGETSLGGAESHTSLQTQPPVVVLVSPTLFEHAIFHVLKL